MEKWKSLLGVKLLKMHFPNRLMREMKLISQDQKKRTKWLCHDSRCWQSIKILPRKQNDALLECGMAVWSYQERSLTKIMLTLQSEKLCNANIHLDAIKMDTSELGRKWLCGLVSFLLWLAALGTNCWQRNVKRD